MPALEWISVKGFKSIRSIEKLQLTDINVIIGANGSGKSNFIGAFAMLHAIREGRLQTFVKTAGGADNLLHFGSRTTETLSFELAFRSKTNKYAIDLSATSEDSVAPTREIGIFFGDYGEFGYNPTDAGEEAGISKPTDQKVLQYVQGHLDRWRLYHFHDVGRNSPMKKNAQINDNQFLRQDGSNLPAFLYLLREKYPDSYALIRAAVRQVAPFFDDFQLQPLALDSDHIRLAWRHKGSDAYFDVSSFSDGTLRFVALATLLLQPVLTRPSIIIVDEPELGLHPFAIEILASLVKTTLSHTQVVLSTQSPFLLDQFEPEKVLVAEREEGATTLKRLDHDKLKEWLEDYSLGELWEKNEFGGRPGTSS